MTLRGRAVLPTASGLFVHTDDPGFRALRDTVDAALTALPTVEAFVLLAAGDEALVHDASAVTLVVGDHPHVQAKLRPDEALLAALSARGQFPRVRDDQLGGPLAVLALLVHAVQPAACVLPVTVPRAAGLVALEAVAAGIVGAAHATERRVAVVAAGELALQTDTEHAAPPERPTAFDEAVVAALESGDLQALSSLGPMEAGDRGALGWAPQTVLLATTPAHGPLGKVAYRRVGGVGRVVAYDLPS